MNYKVLIVDDEYSSSHYIEALIEKKCPGFAVSASAENGRQALEQIDRERPDVLISDIRMPVMDGIELIETVSRSCPDVVLVLVTGYQDFEYARKALRAGVSEYLLKPVKPSQMQQLMEEIKRKLDKSRHERQIVDFHALMKRNMPEDAGQIVEKTDDKDTLFDEILAYMEVHIREELTLSRICRDIGVSQTAIGRMFRTKADTSFCSYLTRLRIERAKEYMRQHPNVFIKDVAAQVGYRDQFYFTRTFRSVTGLTPSEYMEKLQT